MPRISDFSYYLRTGRTRRFEQLTELKFNPWHDPDDGRVTVVGQGRYFGGPARTPSNATPAGQSHQIKLGPVSRLLPVSLVQTRTRQQL